MVWLVQSIAVYSICELLFTVLYMLAFSYANRLLLQDSDHADCPDLVVPRARF